MAGLSGMDEFMNGLNNYVDNIAKLDDVSVSVDSTDTRSTVEGKLRAELRRKGATGFSELEIRGMAESLLNKAHSR
jgi:hypothetical protein